MTTSEPRIRIISGRGLEVKIEHVGEFDGPDPLYNALLFHPDNFNDTRLRFMRDDAWIPFLTGFPLTELMDRLEDEGFLCGDLVIDDG